MTIADPPRGGIADFLRDSARQEQFLTVLSREDAFARFMALARDTGAERRALDEVLGERLAATVSAPGDVPAFDRSDVDGVAVRAADVAAAGEVAPVILRLNPEVLACGVDSRCEVAPGTATVIATGGMIPRGADAVVMVEHTGTGMDGVSVEKPANPGQFITRAGSDIALGETILRAGARMGPREIGMLAAAGISEVEVRRRPVVAVLSTGNELVAPGAPLGPGQVYDSNGAAIAAAVVESGGRPLPFGVMRDDLDLLTGALAQALAEADIVVISGGTSKGAGDVSYRALDLLPELRLIAHGVALKPGKPLCLASVGGTPLAVLPGFPTSAMFTFHAFVAPLIRAMAGTPEEAAPRVRARLATRLPSELGRAEFAMVALAEGEGAPLAIPLGKGSGAVTAFARADGFVEIEALADGLDAGSEVDVSLLDSGAKPPDLFIVGSHCVGIDALLERLPKVTARIVAAGSQGGLAALRRGECDLAPIHLLDRASGIYNAPFLPPGASLVKGWRRRQGLVHRRGDARFEGADAATAVAGALADPACLMVSRNAGAGTRVLIDDLLNGARPPGYDNQPRSHNAVAAAVAQGKADWGIAIDTVAARYGLGFLPLADEHFDFAVADSRRERRAVRAFLDLLESREARDALAALGFGAG